MQSGPAPNRHNFGAWQQEKKEEVKLQAPALQVKPTTTKIIKPQ